MNVRKGENGVKRTREHKEFPGGNDSGLSALTEWSDYAAAERKHFVSGNYRGSSRFRGRRPPAPF